MGYIEILSDRLNIAWRVGMETRLSLLWMMGYKFPISQV